MRKVFLTMMLSVLAVLSSALYAQTVSVPYSMGFENSGFDATEASNWVLNPGPQANAAKDKWYIGRAIRESGTQSLYISNDTAQTAKFGTNPCTQYVYRDFLLPASAAGGNATYDVSFDWYCVGAANSYLSVGVALTSNTGLVANSSSGAISTSVSPYVKPVMVNGTSTTQLKGSADNKWQNATFQVTSNGTRAIRLFFVWVNNNTNATLTDPVGACIDNIQITSANCKRPTNITATAISCDSVFVSWNGSSAEYELEYREQGSNYWHKVVGINGGVSASTMLEGLSENSYDIRVRGICTPDTSGWTYESNFIVFCPEQHCINYVDLTDPAVTCYYGSGYNGYHSNPQCAYQNVGIIDYGPESKASRHTVNWDRTAMDPRTGNNLPLVAPGEFASVRLGNWDYNAQAEAIAFDYVVDSTSDILLMKYAVVMEDPDHSPDEQPRFVLDILDANGQQIDPTCGHCDFAASSSASGWRTYGSGYDKVTYKPWTLIGLNLEAYAGQTIKIRLTTYDCSQSGHYGYAYFSLGCASATIATTSCAADPTMQMTLSAPEGFNYTWKNTAGQTVGNTKVLDVASSDTTTYTCILTSKENPTCHFELHSQCMPREPISEFTWKYVGENCKNQVEFTETSFIRTCYNNDTVDHRDWRCEEFAWDIWNTSGFRTTSNRSNPIITFPDDGGTYSVTLTSVISGSCEADTTVTITIPKIQDYYFDLDTTLCQGQYIKFGDQVIATSGEHDISLKTIAGCDSIIHMSVTVNPTYELHLDTTTICMGEDYCEDGDCYGKNKSGMFIRRLATTLGCDSSLMRYIIVKDSILPVITQDSIDLDAKKYTADIHLAGTGYDRIVFQGDTIPMDSAEIILSGLGLGYYEIEFLNDFGCSRKETVLIGGDCLGVTVSEQQVCQGGTPVAIYTLTVDSGMLTTYDVLFEDSTLFPNIHAAEPTHMASNEYQIELPLPSSVEPGTYHAQLILQDLVCGDDTFNIDVFVTYPASILFSRWGDVVSLKNFDAIGHPDWKNYDFVGYQWMLNDSLIDGANLSYYFQEGGLDMEGEYSVMLFRADGQIFITCPFVPAHPTATDEAMIEVLVTPTQVGAGEAMLVSLTEQGRAAIYTATGQLVSEHALMSGSNVISAPTHAGVYIMNVRTRMGSRSVRLIVD